MQATTAVTVKNAISTVTKILVNHFVVKRKYKLNPINKSVSKWWFVIRGEEEVLKMLEAKWPSVSLQTAWKLEEVLAITELSSQPAESHSPAAKLSTLSNNASHGHSENSNAVSQCSASNNETMPSQDLVLMSHTCLATESTIVLVQQ